MIVNALIGLQYEDGRQVWKNSPRAVFPPGFVTRIYAATLDQRHWWDTTESRFKPGLTYYCNGWEEWGVEWPSHA